MIIENKTSYNDSFWNYLDYKLKTHFRNTGFNYSFIYPIEITADSILKKRKSTNLVLVNSRIILHENDKEKEYLGKIILGNYSQKAYINTKGIDYTKCYPTSDTSNWIKIDEINNEIEIILKIRLQYILL